MALRSEPGIPAVYVLLGEKMCDFKHSSGWCESRSLFIASGFGTREAGAPLASGVFIANCPLSLLPQRLLLFS